MGSKSSSFYFITKPLQYFNVLNLSLNDINDKYLFIIPNFHNASEFFSKILEYDHRWKEIKVIESKLDMSLLEYTVNKGDAVYVHSDMHWELKFVGEFAKAKIIVYEEGLGTYSKEITSITKSWLKNLVIKILTRIKYLNSVTGGDSKTQSVYVYNKPLFEKENPINAHKSITFEYNFFDNYRANKYELDQIFELNNITFPKYSHIALYLTSNDSSIDFLSIFNSIDKNKYDEMIFKSHPNVASYYNRLNNSYTNIMAELLIVKLLECGNTIDVYHFGTAVELYINSHGVKFFKL